MATFHLTAFYRFTPISDPADLRNSIESFCREHLIYGLILVAAEGVNGTISGSVEAIAAFKHTLGELLKLSDLEFKDSVAERRPFRRLKVKIKEEIVDSGNPDLKPASLINHHLPPTEWNAVLESGEDFILLDTRNTYETAVGMFEGAVDPKIEKFNQFVTYVDQAQIPKDKKVLMYCTGGIRCEKAILQMQERGYENVFQLQGGILKYLEEFPNKHFKGECFVFDHRVSVDQSLSPSSRYGLCPHCGDPGETRIECKECGAPTIVCESCLAEPNGHTCSKNCAYHHNNKNQVRSASLPNS